jgi:predicted phosphoribosyltransferase
MVVLGIPRGGVAVARSLADKLQAPLGVVVTKKIVAPLQEELAIGAVGPEGESILDTDLIQKLGIEEEVLAAQIEKARAKVKRYQAEFKDQLDLRDKNIILVDDGIATGATVKAAIKHLRSKKIKKLILAVPIAPQDIVSELKRSVDEMVVLETPRDFQAVGEFYESFPQVSDEEVLQLLQ